MSEVTKDLFSSRNLLALTLISKYHLGNVLSIVVLILYTAVHSEGNAQSIVILDILYNNSLLVVNRKELIEACQYCRVNAKK